MSSRSRGFWAVLFGAGRGGGAAAAPLFQPPEPRPRELPRAALPPAAPPGIVIEPPRPEPPPVKLPADVPPPAPPPTAEVAPAVVASAAVASTAVALAFRAPPRAEPAPARRAAAADLPPPLPIAAIERPAAEPPVAQPPAGEAVPEAFLELADLAAASVAVAQPGFWGGQLPRLAVAPPAPLPSPTPLLEGTERFTDNFLIDWHRTPRPAPPRDVGCYFATDAIVTGPGHVWLDGRLVTSPELMPGYVYTVLDIARDGARLLGAHSLPMREIAAPCVVLLGHGLHVYGHFIIEMLFRVLLVRRALRGTGLAVRWLLDASAPAWLLRILHDDLGIPPDSMELFDGGELRVRLRQAILPGLLHGEQGFHPLAGALIEELLDSLAPLPRVPAARRLFVARRGFRNPHVSHPAVRECRNEPALVALAAKHGFVPIAAEELPWRQQLALFRNAEMLIGPFGSALHTALVSPAGTRVGVLGLMNPTQSEIASLRGHSIGYLTRGFDVNGQFDVPEDAFAAFLDALCAPAASARAAERPAEAAAVVPAAAPAPAPSVGMVAGAVAIEKPEFDLARVGRYVVAAAASPRLPQPLLVGTEPFAAPAQRAVHGAARIAPAREAVCYFAADAIVGAGGVVWLDGAPVTAPELLPRPLAPPAGAAADLPLRDIDAPCVVVPGQSAETYAGFVIDTLPRLLLARRAIYDTGERIRLLLDAGAPNWLGRLLRVDLGFKENELPRFSPRSERVRLRRAMLPGALYGEGGFHPLVADLVYQLVNRLKLPDVPMEARLFVLRPAPAGQAAETPRGDCRNEAALVALAEAQGFVPVTLDTLPWRERVARLRHARVVLVGAGANVHTLLLAGEGTRVATIGARSSLAAEIGALRGHRMAYLSEGVPPKGPFTVPEDRFAAFLVALCDPNAEAAQAA